MSKIVAVLLLAVAAAQAAYGSTNVLISSNAVWKFLDDGSDQGAAWREPGFDDAAWGSGPAELGYGDGDERTVIASGTNMANKHVTSYFRHSFVLPKTNTFISLRVGLVRDDGAIVYLNGREVFRSNIPATNVDYRTLSAEVVGGADESRFFYGLTPGTNLLQGTNVLAVEVHQSATNSSDLSFNATLEAYTTPFVVRGPYLQIGTSSNVVVRWRTDVPTDSRVWVTGSNIAKRVYSDARPTVDHVVRLTNLTASATYRYSIGTSKGVSLSDSNLFFTTAPRPGARKPTRLWVLGDSGTGDRNAANVRDGYFQLAKQRRADLCLMLGDNAYPVGADQDYQDAVFDMYPTVLANMVFWPTIGNHDTAFVRDTNGFPYLDIFTLPTRGEAGGIASGTEKYYSFDYANIHFVCLDSMTSDTRPDGAMATWLRNDLAATMHDWIIAFFHHPPYSKGSHDSDFEPELIEMRTNMVPILEAGGVDLVLCGHSHSYERSYLLNGHYGSSTTFTNTMKVDAGSGRTNTGAAYHKAMGINANRGAVYAVAGSSGQTDHATLDHPAMYIGLEALGSLLLDVNSNRLDAAFIGTNSVVLDQFSIIKDAPKPARPIYAPAALTAAAFAGTQGLQRVVLQWTDANTNETGFRIERSADRVAWRKIGATGANRTNYVDGSVGKQKTYWYRVQAFNSAGVSPYSGVARARVVAAPPPPVPVASVAVAEARGDVPHLRVNGQHGSVYTIEESTNLVNWTPIGTVTNVGGTLPLLGFGSDGGTRFYRARLRGERN